MQNIISNLDVSESELMKTYDIVKNIKYKNTKISNVSILTIGKINILLNWNFFLGKKICNQIILEMIHDYFPEILHNREKLLNKWHVSMKILFSRWSFQEIYDFLSSIEITDEQLHEEIFIIQNNISFINDFYQLKLDYENYQKENERVLDKMWDEFKELKTENDNIFQLISHTEKENEKLNQEIARYMRENMFIKEELRELIDEYKKLDVNYRKRCSETIILESKLKLLDEKYKMQTNEIMLILEKNESLLDENEELYEKLSNEKNNCFKFFR